MPERPEIAPRPSVVSDADALARTLIERTAGRIRLALPLGIGKANTIANALTRAALRDPSIDLSIFTALTLERPDPSSEMERRFLEPALDRLFGDYPPLLYAEKLHAGELPSNIRVNEFFVLAGRWLGIDRMQQGYISANYSQACDVLIGYRPNVVAQLVAREGTTYSLSGNTDITADLLTAQSEGRADFLFAGEVNTQLPFMGGTAEIPADRIDILLDDRESHFELFSIPKRPVGLADHAIGIRVSQLVRDGGTLQIGIGSIGDAVAHAMLMRHQQNPTWRDATGALGQAPLPGDAGDGAPFETGLYATTEMLVDGILQLFEAGIIRREVDGAAIHAGFFADSRDFYRRLRELPAEDRARIAMMPVSFTNTLYDDEPAKRAGRRDARFVNTTMNVTLLGEAASDTLPDGRVVSGVGGQHDFVTQAFALEGGRAVMALNATRPDGSGVSSNIVASHPHLTVPRHLRDIVVTEYGIADLRGKSDGECIAAMLRITDNRFQDELMEKAKAAGKLPDAYTIPEDARRNTPEALAGQLVPFDLPTFPFGTDFDTIERRLIPALEHLKAASRSRTALARLALDGLRTRKTPRMAACLRRMRLDAPRGLHERAMALLLRGAMRASGDASGED